MTVWRQSEKYKIPRIAYINKMDKFGASFENSLKSIQKKLKTIPIGKTNKIKVNRAYNVIFLN